jgi:hypothetical protein
MPDTVVLPIHCATVAQATLFTELELTPSAVRLEYDEAICNVIGVNVSSNDLRDLCEVIVQEMIVTRALKSD